jgi:hypothetical protein
MDSLWSSLISIPAISEDLRAQLAAIDPQTRDIYLPVIDGLGRETELGGTTGYIYATSDLTNLIGKLPEMSGGTRQSQLQNENASALIMTNNGILYLIIGQKSDSELSQIARSLLA